ncbi:MAG TPA: Holliday junction resolvase RuvX [Steroidobacteraceae bacterium]|jgi:putative Holliday junction resolvase|nr:Holliday junction resolvase RuvX [Steroidobacteraceae bacterium]
MNGGTNAAPLIVLAFDFGTRRIGVASGNTLTRMPQPLCTLEYKQQLPWNEINQLLRDYLPKQLVVGLPYNTDDSPTPLTPVVKAFADELATRSNLPVELVDERNSSQEAERELAYLRNTGLKTRRVTHADVDKLAAKVVLQRWFDGRG